MIARFRRGKGDDGAAAVEFALVLPLLLILVFGVIAFGFALFAKITASHGAREGARLAAVGIENCATWAATVAERTGTALNVDPDTGANVVEDTVTMAIDDEDGDGKDPGDEITVTFTYNLEENSNGVMAGVSSLISAVPGGGFVIPNELEATAISRAEVVDQEAC